MIILIAIDVRRVAVNSPILRKENEVIESKDVELDHSNQSKEIITSFIYLII